MGRQRETAAKLVHTAIQATAKRVPENIAVSYQSQRQTLTYAELVSDVDRLRAALWHEGGIRPGMRVAVMVEHSPALLRSLLAVLQCGAAYVPIDPAFPAQRVGWILEDADVSGVITSPQVISPEIAPLLSGLHALTPDAASAQPFPAEQDGGVAGLDIVESDLCYMIFTSGSTGRPKGVEICHANVVDTLHGLAERTGIGAQDAFLAATTVSFDIAMAELFLPLLYGGRVVIGNDIAEPSLTVAQATPVQWRLWREQGWQGNPNLTALCGGEAMPRDVADWLLGHTRRVYNVYGPTETTIWSTAAHIQDAEQIDIGTPLRGEHVYILDDQLQPVPRGEEGEICIAGIGVGRGYWNRAELTAQQFVSNPQRPAERLYRTGDLGYELPNGVVQCLGRLDHQIKLHGYRIELGEIESAFSAREGLGQTVVRVRQEGQARNLVAFITEQHASIDQWSEIWDTAYAQADEGAARADVATNYAGYSNSLSPGELHRETSINELQDTTAQRLLALRPERVLEMGMGLGMILFRVVPHCRHYHGSDVSPTACEYVQSILADRSDDLDVQISQAAAHELSQLGQDQEGYDLIIINGTVAYFPNLAYLVQVIAQARNCLRPGGCLFLGDVRSAPHLDHFAAATVAAESDGAENSFRERVTERIDAERELLIDAGWFSTWAGEYFETVELQLHRGWDHNEFTMFRFDALLFAPGQKGRAGQGAKKEPGAQKAPPPPPLIAWEADWDSSQIRTRLERLRPESLGFSGLPNARLKATAELLGRPMAGSPIEPEECYALAEQAEYQAQVIWSSAAAECFDVLFVRADCTVSWLSPPSMSVPERTAPERTVAAPTARRLRPHEVADLRAHLGDVLPSYMIPSEYIAIDRVPHTPNGKIDTPALLALEPESDEHADLPSLIASLLGVDRALLEPQARLHELGLDSLTAMRLRSMLSAELGLNISLRDLIGQDMTLADLQRAVLREGAEKDSAGSAVQIRPVEQAPGSLFDLSVGQQEILAAVQLAGERNPVLYTAQISFQLSEPIDRSVLQAALVTLIDRHPILRVVIEGGQQKMRPTLAVALTETPEALLRPFDLSVDVPVRICLSDENCRVDIAAHHFAVDGQSLALLAGELFDLCTQPGVESEPPAMTYADFVAWQSQIQTSGFWEQALDDGRTSSDAWPYDWPAQPQRSWTGGTLRQTLSAQAVAALERMGAKSTLPSVLLALAAGLLQRYTHNSEDAEDGEYVIGLLSDGRSRTEWLPVIGHFVRLLPIRLGFNGETTFSDIAAQARDSILTGLDHQDEAIPRVKVSVVVNYYALPAPPIEGIQTLFPDQQEGQFDLAFWFIRHTDGGMHVEVKYADDRFERGTAELMAQQLTELLQAAAVNPDLPIRSLMLQDADQITAQVAAWNDTAADIDHSICIPSMIDGIDADRLAVDELTYRQFRLRTEQLAHKIYRATGGDPEIRVGLYMQRSTALVVALIATLKSGQTYVPLEPSYPLKRLDYMVEVAAVGVIISHADLMDEARSRFPQAIVVDADDVSDASLGEPMTGPLPGVDPEAIAYILFTSGTTGNPKGVMVCHRALSNRIQWMQREYGLTSTDVVIQKTPFTFDVSIWEFVWPLAVGAHLVVAPPGLHMEPGGLLDFVAEQNVTVMHFVPSMLRLLLDHPQAQPHRLRHIICSGEALSPALRDSFFDSPLRQVRLHNLYGPTEACIDVSFWECQSEESGIVPIGRPVSNTQLYIVNVNDTTLAAPGCPGELWIGGVQVAAGYAGNAELTNERFIPNPFDAGMVYRTGDLARWRYDGAIVFLGRIDRQIKLHGQRLELGEVEAVLHAAPGVRHALAALDEQTEGRSRLVAFVAPADIQVAEVRAFAGQHLAAGVIPAAILAVDDFPTGAHGKVDIGSLLEQLHASESSRQQALESYSPLETDSERQVAQQFKVLLKLGQEPGRESDFFALGGDSLSAIRLVMALERGFGSAVPVSVVLEVRTVQAIAAHIDTEPAVAQSEQIDITTAYLPSVAETLPEGVATAYRVTDIQARMLDDYGDYYHSREIYRFESEHGAIDPEALGRALAAQVERHPPMRARFWRVAGGWAQGFRERFDLRPSVHDLRQLTADEQERLLLDRVERQAPRLFHVEEGDLLFRAELFWLNEKTAALLFESHHAIYDGWSDAVLIAETLRDYVRGDGSREVVSQTLPERIALESVAVQDQRIAAFWAERVEGARRVTRPALGSLASRSIVLSDATVRQVERCGQRHGVTTRAVFLGAFAELIHHYRSEDCIGVVTNTRTPQMTDPLDAVGMFWNLLPVRYPGQDTSQNSGQDTDGDLDGNLGALQHQLLEMEMEDRAHYPPSRLPRVSDSVFMFTDFNSLYDQDLGIHLTKPWMSDRQNAFLHLTVFFKASGEKTRIILNAPTAEIDLWCGRYQAVLTQLCSKEA